MFSKDAHQNGVVRLFIVHNVTDINVNHFNFLFLKFQRLDIITIENIIPVKAVLSDILLKVTTLTAVLLLSINAEFLRILYCFRYL